MPTTDELDLKIADLKRLLDATVKLRAAQHEYEAAMSGLPQSHVPHVVKSSFPSMRGRVVRMSSGGNITASTADIAAVLMEKEGKPVSTGEIIQALRAAGMELPESNASNIVSARMSNNKARFTGRRGEGWWFADKPWPQIAARLALSDEAESGHLDRDSATPLHSSQEGGGSNPTTLTS